MNDYAKAEGGRNAGDLAAGVVQLLGGGLALVGLPFLLVQAAAHPSAAFTVSFSIYGASILYFFAISALAHLLERPGARRVMGALDDAGSFFLVAGSYTPFCLTSFHGAAGWIILGLLWGFAVILFLATIIYNQRIRELALAVYYLAFTLFLPLMPSLRSLLPETVFPWTLLAGLVFALGLAFRSRGGMPYHHAIWHSFTLAASVVLFFALLALH